MYEPRSGLTTYWASIFTNTSNGCQGFFLASFVKIGYPPHRLGFKSRQAPAWGMRRALSSAGTWQCHGQSCCFHRRTLLP